MNKALSPAELAGTRITATIGEGRNAFELEFEPAATCPDWVLIIRATWSWVQLQLEALREVERRHLRLASELRTHTRIFAEALRHAHATGGI